MGKVNYKDYHGVGERDIGIRYWYKYSKPFTFNIVVNDMREVMKHEDLQLPQNNYFGLQSSAAGWGYHAHV